MLPRDQRLRASRDFQRVYRGGRSWAHPLLILHVRQQPQGQRVGISVSKKLGCAVRRNRVRRRIRELARLLLPEWRLGFDAVVVARNQAADAPFEALGDALRELARRARLPRELSDGSESLYSMPAPRPGREGGRQRPAAGDAGSYG